jgi:hypothetical protein
MKYHHFALSLLAGGAMLAVAGPAMAQTKIKGAVPDSRFLGLSWYLCARAGSADINKTV